MTSSDATHGDVFVHAWNELADEHGVPRITPENDPRRMDLDQRLSLRLPPDHPAYDAFYDDTDETLAAKASQVLSPPASAAGSEDTT